MSSLPQPRLTPEEYLVIERDSEHKSEFFNGEIFAMTGASREHNLIASNVSGSLWTQLRGRPCEMYSSDMRVKVSPTGLYTYPDVVVVCGEPQFEDAHVDTLLNPTVIVEVLSESTEAYDRGRKFGHYRRVASLAQYVLVSQSRPMVEWYTRQGEHWVLREASEVDDALVLETIDCRVPLGDIYERVAFPEEETTDVPA